MQCKGCKVLTMCLFFHLLCIMHIFPCSPFRIILLLAPTYYTNNYLDVHNFFLVCGPNNNNDYHHNHHLNSKHLLNTYVSVTVRYQVLYIY